MWSQYAALPLRLGLGLFFLAWGLGKLTDLTATGELMAAAGFTPGAFWAALAGLLELVGGIGLLAGVLTRWVALSLAVERLIALLVVHVFAPAAWAPTMGGPAFPLIVVAALVSLAMMGPQALALDTRIPALAALSGSGEGQGAYQARTREAKAA
ncbi:MAG: DoxX family protein [Candidatus Rokubacteria bacterium]|nr:DoxX family protein [Candidatus Rokubacteria bacterium]